MESRLGGLFDGRLRAIRILQTGRSPRIVRARVVGSSGSNDGQRRHPARPPRPAIDLGEVHPPLSPAQPVACAGMSDSKTTISTRGQGRGRGRARAPADRAAPGDRRVDPGRARVRGPERERRVPRRPRGAGPQRVADPRARASPGDGRGPRGRGRRLGRGRLGGQLSRRGRQGLGCDPRPPAGGEPGRGQALGREPDRQGAGRPARRASRSRSRRRAARRGSRSSTVG